MAELKFIKDVTLKQRGVETQELFAWGDKHIVVSTVDLGGRYAEADPSQRAIMDMGDMAGAMLGKPTRDPHAEDSIETMAFYCDENGEDWDYSEVIVAHGHDSREKVLDRLRELEPGVRGEVV